MLAITQTDREVTFINHYPFCPMMAADKTLIATVHMPILDFHAFPMCKHLNCFPPFLHHILTNKTAIAQYFNIYMYICMNL